MQRNNRSKNSAKNFQNPAAVPEPLTLNDCVSLVTSDAADRRLFVPAEAAVAAAAAPSEPEAVSSLGAAVVVDGVVEGATGADELLDGSAVAGEGVGSAGSDRATCCSL